MSSYYVTTPIYYVNDAPHLGHAYTTIACDVLARFWRIHGRDVFFLTGTDEHGQKVAQSAAKRDMDAQSFTDEVSQKFRELVNSGDNLLNITNDDFIRTTEERHKLAAKALWRAIEANGHIYKGSYSGWYSVRDEAYYQESELIDGRAPTGAEVTWMEEDSYFFDLSKWQEKLLELYRERPDFILPQSRYNEVVSFVEGGLKDLSISRTSFDWGVDVPGADGHVMYVWIDALTNYLTAVGYPDTDAPEYRRYWTEAEQSPVHIVGKDILRFHAVYWPAFLMAAGLPVPHRIVAHGWWTIEGQKMSKSLGNVISPQELVGEYGVDAVRYFLMREIPFGNDGNFARENLITRVNTELANTVGNLAQRTLSMVAKNCDGKVPDGRDFTEDDLKIMHQMRELNLEKKMDVQDFSGALEKILHFARKANEYIDEQAPWTLRKTDHARMETVLYTLLEVLRSLGIMLQPFTPDAAGRLLDQLSVPQGERMSTHRAEHYRLKAQTKLSKPEGIFPRIEG